VKIKVALPLSRDLGDAEVGEVDVALRTWSSVRCSAWRGEVDGTAPVAGDDDGVSSVVWHDTDWPAAFTPGALAQTIVRVDNAGKTREIDVHINGVDHRWSIDGRAGTVDARGVLVHELGHALGLGHSDVTTATMYASGPQGLAWRSLEKDDVDGVCALYPGTGASGCDRGGAPCPAGFLCLADACERPGTTGALCAPCDRVPGACAASGEDARCVDQPNGARACGRACATDADCGGEFRCKPTTEAGDLQCVPDDSCGLPAAPRDGGASDAASADAAAPPPPSAAGGGGGCALAPDARSRGPSFAAAVALLALRARRRRASSG
jgi:hypothetical protein